MFKVTQLLKDVAIKNVRLIQTTNVQFFDKEWRRKKRLTKNPNTESPLTYLPDYSFMDGRPAPTGFNMNKRLRMQKWRAKKIVQGIFEIDYAEKRYIRMQKEDEQRRQEIIDSKLKPKGNELLKSP